MGMMLGFDVLAGRRDGTQFSWGRAAPNIRQQTETPAPGTYADAPHRQNTPIGDRRIDTGHGRSPGARYRRYPPADLLFRYVDQVPATRRRLPG
jgi:hypothetical protein